MKLSDLQPFDDEELKKFLWIVERELERGEPDNKSRIYEIAQWLATIEKYKNANIRSRTTNGGDK